MAAAAACEAGAVTESLGLVVVLRAPLDDERERVVLLEFFAGPAVGKSGDVLS